MNLIINHNIFNTLKISDSNLHLLINLIIKIISNIVTKENIKIPKIKLKVILRWLMILITLTSFNFPILNHLKQFIKLMKVLKKLIDQIIKIEFSMNQ